MIRYSVDPSGVLAMRRAALPVTFTDLLHHVATGRADYKVRKASFGKYLRPQRHDVVGRLADLPVAPGGPVTKHGPPLVKPTRPFIASSHVVPHLMVESASLNLIAVAGLLCGPSRETGSESGSNRLPGDVSGQPVGGPVVYREDQLPRLSPPADAGRRRPEATAARYEVPASAPILVRCHGTVHVGFSESRSNSLWRRWPQTCEPP